MSCIAPSAMAEAAAPLVSAPTSRVRTQVLRAVAPPGAKNRAAAPRSAVLYCRAAISGVIAMFSPRLTGAAIARPDFGTIAPARYGEDWGAYRVVIHVRNVPSWHGPIDGLT